MSNPPLGTGRLGIAAAISIYFIVVSWNLAGAAAGFIGLVLGGVYMANVALGGGLDEPLWNLPRRIKERQE